uniref:Large ribosomal subunit protein mL45 n=1 Tax=Ciona savignyi TaxID=51511 RepID=H2Z6C9_CIOSA
MLIKGHEFMKKLEETAANNQTNQRKMKQDTKKFLKKNQRYADYNYQEWRFPKSSRAIDISCTRGIMEPHKDDKSGTKSSLNLRKKLTNLRSDIVFHRMIKKRVASFHRKRFPAEAQDIYVKAHTLLNTPNWTIVNREETEETLQNLVTEHAYEDMVKGLDCKTMITDDNYYGQVTVRFHSKQTLAIYDRFGRLMYGSPDVARNVLEFVIFERHISHPYGMWRIHGKISSEAYAKEPMKKTVAVIKPKQQRLESIEWHEQEEKEHPFKWYPERYHYIEKRNNLKTKRRDKRYWGIKRKQKIYNYRRGPIIRLRSRVARAVQAKREAVLDMRKQGKLPYPPKDQNV